MENNEQFWLEAVGDSDVKTFQNWVTPGFEALFSSLVIQSHAHEGSLWFHDPQSDRLTIAHNTGPQAAELEGAIHVPADEGLIGKCFTEQEPILHQGLFRHKEASQSVDKELRQQTHYQATVPFFLASKPVGVITLVQLSRDAPRTNNPAQWGFDNETLELLQKMALPLAELLELGWRKATNRTP